MNHAEMTTNLLIQYIAVGIILLATVVWIIVKFIKTVNRVATHVADALFPKTAVRKRLSRNRNLTIAIQTTGRNRKLRNQNVMKTIKIWNSDASERQLNEITRDLEGEPQ